MATVARGLETTRTGARRFWTPRAAGYLLVLPAGLYVLLLIGFPLVLGVCYSLTNTTVANPGRRRGRAELDHPADDRPGRSDRERRRSGKLGNPEGGGDLRQVQVVTGSH